jgi:hypothetical protein
MITKLLKKAKETAKCIHQVCYDFCYDLIEGDEPSRIEQVPIEGVTGLQGDTGVPTYRISACGLQEISELHETSETPSEQPVGFQPVRADHSHSTLSVGPRPTFMRGYLCASFEDETSLGMAATVVAIDRGHARSLLNAELRKQGLRLEDDDKLFEIDLHNPGVLLSRNGWDSPQYGEKTPLPWDSV